MDNPIFRELPDEEECFSLKSDERVYLDLRATSGYVKEAEKLERNDSKINLQITLKNLSKSGLTLKHRTYAINQSDEYFLE